MIKNKQTGNRITAVYLPVISGLLCFVILALLVTPNITRFYVTHIKYKVNDGITEDLKQSELFADLESGKSICFLGDSITRGSATGGIPWYQSVSPYIKGKVTNFSKSGWMVKDLIESGSSIPVSDIYVVAIGINDIIFSKNERTSPDSSEYVKRLEQLARIIEDKSSEAKIYFITPWPISNSNNTLDERFNHFHDAIIEWCESEDYICIDSQPIIDEVRDVDGSEKYMYDEVHPNSTNGVALYCYAVLKAGQERKTAKL